MAALTAAARSRLVAAVATVILATGVAVAQPAPPALTGPVNDFAGVIDGESASALTELSQKLLAASGDALVVATVRSTKEWGDIRAYATRMFENGGRGIGQQGKDNGLLVLLAVDDRQVWVEVGYDLEGFVTDGFAGETSREVMTPYFRSGEYGAGLLAGSRRLAERIAQGRNVDLALPAPVAAPRQAPEGNASFIILIFVLFFIVIPILQARRAGGRGSRHRWRGHTGSWGGGYSGGSWGGGSSWGGGGGGGGFGGFGGGRSGGGGGGASW
jgi:uncharacterized protein